MLSFLLLLFVFSPSNAVKGPVSSEKFGQLMAMPEIPSATLRDLYNNLVQDSIICADGRKKDGTYTYQKCERYWETGFFPFCIYMVVPSTDKKPGHNAYGCAYAHQLPEECAKHETFYFPSESVSLRGKPYRGSMMCCMENFCNSVDEPVFTHIRVKSVDESGGVSAWPVLFALVIILSGVHPLVQKMFLRRETESQQRTEEGVFMDESIRSERQFTEVLDITVQGMRFESVRRMQDVARRTIQLSKLGTLSTTTAAREEEREINEKNEKNGFFLSEVVTVFQKDEEKPRTIMRSLQSRYETLAQRMIEHGPFEFKFDPVELGDLFDSVAYILEKEPTLLELTTAKTDIDVYGNLEGSYGKFLTLRSKECALNPSEECRTSLVEPFILPSSESTTTAAREEEREINEKNEKNGFFLSEVVTVFQKDEEKPRTIMRSLQSRYETLAQRMIEHGPFEFKFDPVELGDLFDSVAYILEKEPTLLELSTAKTDIDVYGNLEGCYGDLFRWFHKNGWPPKRKVLFLGGLTNDREHFSLETISLIFALKQLMPNHVYILRGAAEVYPIKIEGHGLSKRVCLCLSDAIQRTCSYLPLAASVYGTVLLSHGGVSPKLTKLKQITNIKRPLTNIPKGSIAADLIFSQASHKAGMVPGSRGWQFTKDFVPEIKENEDSAIKLVIRSRNWNKQGYQSINDSILSLWSAPGIPSVDNAAGACLTITQDFKLIISKMVIPGTYSEKKLARLEKARTKQEAAAWAAKASKHFIMNLSVETLKEIKATSKESKKDSKESKRKSKESKKDSKEPKKTSNESKKSKESKKNSKEAKKETKAEK